MRVEELKSFSFTVPGPLPSWNHSYKIVKFRTGDKQRLGFAKVPGLEAWQTSVGLIVRAARPSGWTPGEHIRITYDFYMHRKMDADNALKSLNDAIAAALGVDDDIFLPCVMSKTVDKQNPRAEVTID